MRGSSSKVWQSSIGASAYVGDRAGGKPLYRDRRPDQRDLGLEFQMVALGPGGQALDLFQCGI